MFPLKSKTAFSSLKFSVEMGRIVLVEKHPNDNTEKPANLRHESSFQPLLPTPKVSAPRHPRNLKTPSRRVARVRWTGVLGLISKFIF
jgi:hypothetical protein